MNFFLALIFSLIFIVVGIVRWKIHPFFVLLLAALGYGFLSGMDPALIVDSVNSGFGNIMGSIGLIIYFGVVIGTVLEKSGGAMVIAQRLLRLIGEKSVHLAMLITGFIISIPVFVDSGFIIMNSLNKALTHRAKLAFGGTTAALALGLMATHVMVPPTPGPIAAAGILGADLGSVILWGMLVCMLALISCYFFATRIAAKVHIPINMEVSKEQKHQPKLSLSLLCILVPILLIMTKSILEYPGVGLDDTWFYSLFSFLGTPVMALLAGVGLSFLLPAKVDHHIYSSSGWLGEALLTAAPIIMITGAGGIFGTMLQNSGIGDLIAQNFVGGSLGLLFPFLLAAGLKTTQGSSTVALITAASIVAPMMASLGLDEPFERTLTVLAIGAGSAVVSHANDSYFWVVTQLTGMDMRQGNQVLTLGTLVLGVTSIIIIVGLSLLF